MAVMMRGPSVWLLCEQRNREKMIVKISHLNSFGFAAGILH